MPLRSMSGGNWLHNPAVRGWLIAAALWLLACPALGEEGPQDNEPVAEQADQAAEPKQGPAGDDLDAPFWKDKGGSTGTYREICEKPKNREYADLCQQWRTAEAAEKQVELARWQLLASILGIAGLLGTIIYTHLSYRLTATTTRRQLRAYLTLSGCDIDWQDEHGPFAYISIKNGGQTPAYGLTGWVHQEVRPKSFDPPSKDTVAPHNLGAGDSHVIPSFLPGPEIRLLTAILDETESIYLWGEITYTDIFKEPHRMRFRLVASSRGCAPGRFRYVCCDEGNESD